MASDASIMQRLAGSNEQRTALQFAFYNTLLFVLLGICFAGLCAVYQMLYMFLSPMLWAVLVGTVLFPFKHKVTNVVKDWLGGLQQNDTPLLIGTILLPFNAFFNFAETVYTTATSQTGAAIVGAYVGLKILGYERTFMYLIGWLGRLYGYVDSFVLFFSKKFVFPLIAIYFIGYATWVYLQPRGTINKKFARTLSLPLWIYALSFISQYFGPLRVVVFAATAVVLGLISGGIIVAEKEESRESTPAELDEKTGEKVEEVDTSVATKTDATAETSSSTLDTAVSSDVYIRLIVGLCALLWVVRHDSALFIFIVPFLVALFRRLGDALGVFEKFSSLSKTVGERVYPSLHELVHVTVAGPLRQFVRVLFTSDRFLVETLREKMDVLSSIVVMMGLAFGSLFLVFFVAFQLHGETVHLARLASNVVSSHPEWLATAMNYTDKQLDENNIDIDSYVEQGYQQGRAWLAANVRALADPKDTARADMLEEQVKQIVDRLYAMWIERNSKATQDDTQALARGDFWSQLKTVTDLAALKEEITLIVKDNVDTLISIAQSLWAVILINISFLSSIFGAVFGLVLGFGLDLLNLLIELIVFLTMVYYLLASSKERWLPLELASTLTATVSANSPGTSSSSSYDFGGAIEHAISGVFVLSAKMSIFYGLYTYFVHSLFDLNIVFLPSLLAAIFAAIPIMAPYLVAVFGIVELWLVRGEAAAALVFTLASVAPVTFADAAFYREVKGSHPYVTGLAIIGGMYWLGLQGAIIGPIILCSLIVLVNVYAQFAKSS